MSLSLSTSPTLSTFLQSIVYIFLTMLAFCIIKFFLVVVDCALYNSYS